MGMKPLIKQLLRENIDSLIERRKNYPSQIRDFVVFAKKYFGIKGKIKIIITSDKSKTSTLAHYEIGGNIVIYGKDRSLCDLERSIGHELFHVKQFEDGLLNNPAEQGKDGSEIENMANAKAGELIRVWGKMNPIIYEY